MWNAYYQYYIQVSADNSTWTTVVSDTSNTNTNWYQYDWFTASGVRYAKDYYYGHAVRLLALLCQIQGVRNFAG